MAGAVLTPFEDFGKFVVEDQEQTRDLRYEWANSVADIKRDEEIKQLKTLVTKLSEEVNKLENIIVDMGQEWACIET